MKRNIDIKEISDGRLYTSNDMAKVGCGGCAGCCDCCCGMGNSIVLDPYDIFSLTKGLEKTFDELLTEELELNLVDGIPLPNLKMTGEKEKCSFLDEKGRCGIHAFRPGMCRLFPLGRVYENQSFRYFIQVYECAKEKHSKEKISKWLGVPAVKKYEKFINDWHYFLLDIEEEIHEMKDKDKILRMGMNLLGVFYRTSYDTQKDFYEQFYERFDKIYRV